MNLEVDWDWIDPEDPPEADLPYVLYFGAETPGGTIAITLRQSEPFNEITAPREMTILGCTVPLISGARFEYLRNLDPG